MIVPAESFGVELPAYLGRWYEVARTPNRFQDNTPEVDGIEYSRCRASTATYEKIDDQTLSILNRCVRTGPGGRVLRDSASGVARLVEDSNGTRYRIAFGSKLARFFQRLVSMGGFPYWIYAVGPLNAEGQYSWSLVSNPDREYLFVLSRDPEPAPAVQQQMLDRASALELPVSRLVFLGHAPREEPTP